MLQATDSDWETSQDTGKMDAETCRANLFQRAQDLRLGEGLHFNRTMT